MFAASRSGVSPPEPSAQVQLPSRTGCAMREDGERSHSVLWTLRSAPASMSMCMTSIRRLSTTWCSAVHPSGRGIPPQLAGRPEAASPSRPRRHSLASGALMSAPLSSSSLTMAADCGCPVGPHAQMSAVLPPAATVARSGCALRAERRSGRGSVAHDCPSRSGPSPSSARTRPATARPYRRRGAARASPRSCRRGLAPAPEPRQAAQQ